MRFAELDAVTIDGYGTLLVLDSPTTRLRAALTTRGVKREEQEVARAFAAEASYYRPRSHLGRDPASLSALREDCVGVFLHALGDPLEPRDFVFTPVEGAVETLDLLRSRGLPLAVVANWDCALPEHLGRLGLDTYFSAILTSAAAGSAKPDPAIFRMALTRLGAEPTRSVHVGDEAVDEEGARAAGMRFASAPLHTAFAAWS
jgi:putative hydrolase of the HAD superfamily